MIKKLFTLGLALAAFAGNAQELAKLNAGKANKTLVTKLNNPASTYSITVDTLMPASAMAGGCAVGTNTAISGFVYYGINQTASHDSGYYFGTGTFPSAGISITEIAQKYTVGSSAASVTNVLVFAGVATGATVTTTAKIYSQNATSFAPNAVMGTSTALPMSSYSTAVAAHKLTNYSFATPVALTANSKFFASITIPTMGGADKDTLAVLTTQLGCSSTDSLSWIKLNPIGWYSVNHGFGANLDIMIFPVIDINSVGIQSFVAHGDLSLYAASPNPASNSININFSVEKPSSVEIQVYDITGKILKTVTSNNVIVGKNAIALDLTSLDAGSYFYSINANGNKMFSKFVVSK